MEKASQRLMRNGIIVQNKFKRYLVPCIMTAIALSLNEFADSLVVSRLIGAEAMSIVNIGSPVIYIFCAVYLSFGTGGSILYASYLGKRKNDMAAKICTVSMLTACALGVLIMLLGLVFLRPVANLLCPTPELLDTVINYLRIMFISAPVTIGVFTLSNFFAAAGNPGISTTICIIANGVNILFDFIYIGLIGMNVVGAALASLTGYIVGILYLLIVFLRKKTYLTFGKVVSSDFRNIKAVTTQGISSAANQLGWTVKLSFCNNLALRLGGVDAMNVFSVCLQTLSIISIAFSGIMDSFTPILAVLDGQEDRRGMSFVVKKGFIYLVIAAVGITMAFELFAKGVLSVFNVTDPNVVPMGVSAIRIFTFMFVFRLVYLMLMAVMRVTGHKIYAFVISVVDGMVAIVVIGLILTNIMGLDGLWYSFPVSSILILLGTFIYDMICVKKSNGTLHGYFMLKGFPKDMFVRDITIKTTDQNISELSTELSEYLMEKGVSHRISNAAGLLAEEMALYTRLHGKKMERMDILTKVYTDHMCMDFRSDGTPFNPMERDEKDVDENYALLSGLPDRVKYDYILGMNCTQFIFNIN